jgi:16S rRNA (adenine1518-N6/adenine1519-N6)-dimethyltransferase
VDNTLNPTSLDVLGILNQYNLKPDKRLGQNFLIDEVSLQNIVEFAQISEKDTVLEIGSGLGSLTRHLASKAKLVITVEIDHRLIKPLVISLTPYPNTQIIHEDILTVQLDQIIDDEDYLVVANIPYYITSSLIRHIMEASLPPERIILTVQEEVAERICASSGNMSLLALSVQIYGTPRIKARIPSSAFFPQPKVDSAVIRIDFFSSPRIQSHLIDDFFRLSKAGFSQKRKTLRNSISGGMNLPPDATANLLSSANINPSRRAETLSIDEWIKLVENFQEKF